MGPVGQHLQEDRLYDCYLASRGDGIVDPPVAEHLADCSACQSRYTELVQLMDGVRQSADDATAAIFTEERLHTQRGQIARRLEQLGQAARILNFPGRVETADEGQARRLVANRWLLASAAAGLLVGIGLTSLYDLEFHQRANLNASTTTSAPAQATTPAATPIDDNMLLMRVDDAIERPRTRALDAFQTLTPTYPEISTTER